MDSPTGDRTGERGMSKKWKRTAPGLYEFGEAGDCTARVERSIHSRGWWWWEAVDEETGDWPAGRAYGLENAKATAQEVMRVKTR